MSEQPQAWVWSQYKGVISDANRQPGQSATPIARDKDRVIPLKLVHTTDAAPATRNAKPNRFKYGLLLLVAVLSGLLFPIAALLLIAVAGLLIASGKEPKKTEEFLASLPGGNLLNNLLSQCDRLLS